MVLVGINLAICAQFFGKAFIAYKRIIHMSAIRRGSADEHKGTQTCRNAPCSSPVHRPAVAVLVLPNANVLDLTPAVHVAFCVALLRFCTIVLLSMLLCSIATEEEK
jgi:hypothetical protein